MYRSNPIRSLALVLLFLAWSLTAEARADLPSFTELVEKAGPSVVNISIESTARGPSLGQIPRGTPFDDFFDQFDQFLGKGQERKRKQRSLGSGFVISADGFIVTNNHVVENADKVTVTLDGVGKNLPAKVIGRDPETDLALIKVEVGRTLTALNLGDSSKVKVGEWVVAIGNPFGLDHTVTAGIISAKGRVIGEGPYDDFLQTDASINPGNSGGPLFNLAGEVIGINAAIVASGQGIGFAIPSNVAKDVIAQLRERGKVTRGLMGVGIQDLDANMAKALGLKDTKGALVSGVTPGEPADKAGIKSGDVILEVDGKAVENSRDLTRTVGSLPPGRAVSLNVWRDGKSKSFRVTLAERDPKKLAERGERGDGSKGGGSELLGMSLRPLRENEARALGLKEPKGLLVNAVENGSAAEDAGLRHGDVILEVNQRPVSTIEDMQRIVSGDGSERGVVMLLIRRQGQNLFRSVPIQ